MWIRRSRKCIGAVMHRKFKLYCFKSCQKITEKSVLTILWRKIYLHLTDSSEPMSCTVLLFGSGATCVPQHQPAKMAIDKPRDLNDTPKDSGFLQLPKSFPKYTFNIFMELPLDRKRIPIPHPTIHFYELHIWDWKTFSIKAEPNQKLSKYNTILSEWTYRQK